MLQVILTGIGLFSLSVFIRWMTRPDPAVIKQTKERKEMRLRDEASNRWDA